MSVPARHLPADPIVGEPALTPRPRRRPESTEAQRPPLRVVPRAVRRRRAGLVAVVLVGSVFALMLGLVAFQAKIAQDQMHLDRMERNLRTAEDRLAQLRLQVADLESPARVVTEAQGLGLVRPTPDQITYLGAGSAAAAEVLASVGRTDDPTTSGTGLADEWSALKPLLNGTP